MADVERFGETLRLARLRRRESQVALADDLGISQAMLSRIERGLAYPDPATMKGIARYLGLKVPELRSLVERERLVDRKKSLVAELTAVDQHLSEYESQC